MILKYYSSVAKELKLKVRKFWWLILTSSYRGITVGGKGGLGQKSTMNSVKVSAVIDYLTYHKEEKREPTCL